VSFSPAIQTLLCVLKSHYFVSFAFKNKHFVFSWIFQYIDETLRDSRTSSVYRQGQGGKLGFFTARINTNEPENYSIKIGPDA
jgi:hypothetical protein